MCLDDLITQLSVMVGGDKETDNGLYGDLSKVKIAIYKHRDGNCRHLVIGKGCLYSHPPEWLPVDTLSVRGRDYLFVGWFDIRSSKFIAESVPVLPKFEGA